MILSTSVRNTSTHKDIKLNVKGEFVPKHDSKVDVERNGTGNTYRGESDI